jgi:hypothetical protein
MTETATVTSAPVDNGAVTAKPKRTRRRAPALDALPSIKAYRPGPSFKDPLRGDTTLGFLRGITRAAGAKASDESLIIFSGERVEIHPA